MNTEFQTLKNELELFKADVKQNLNRSFEKTEIKLSDNAKVEVVQSVSKEIVRKPLNGIPDRFFEGAEKFFVNYNAGKGDFYGENYNAWYEDMSRSMENRRTIFQ